MKKSIWKKASSLFKWDISIQPQDVVEFHLGNYGLKSDMLKKIFTQAETQYETDQRHFTEAQHVKSEWLPMSWKVIEANTVNNYSKIQTLKHILKTTGAKNFEHYNQPIQVLQQQKDLLIRLRDIVAWDITEAIEHNENIKDNNKFRNNLDNLIQVFNTYIRDTQVQLLKNLK